MQILKPGLRVGAIDAEVRRSEQPRGADGFEIGRRGSLVQAAAAHLAWMRVVNYADSTVAARAFYLRQFCNWCGDNRTSRARAVNREVVERYQHHLYRRSLVTSPLSPRSQYLHLHALRMFFRWATARGITTTDPAADLQLPRLEQRLPKDILTHAEADAVLRQPNLMDPLGLRDRAILETFYSTAIRRTELTNLRIWDLDRGAGTIRITKGKGGKDRVVPIGDRALAWVDRYVAFVRPLLAQRNGEETLFLTKRGEPLLPKPLSTAVAFYITAAGVGKRGSCHLFRHTCATLMLEGGADIRFIQEMLGHASLASTQIYTRVSIRKLKEVHSATHPGATVDLRVLPVLDEPRTAASRSSNERLSALRPDWKRPYLLAVGRHLGDLRQRRGLSREELARRVGSTRGHIRKLEEGIHPPRPEMVRRLAAALAVEASELIPH